MTALSTNTRTPLSRLRIAQAALAIVDRDGLDALSMRRLGAELGVEGMAIYRHFPNKAAVLAGIVEVLLAELVIPPPSDVPWQTVFREVSRAYRALLLRHPHAIPLLAALPRMMQASWLKSKTGSGLVIARYFGANSPKTMCKNVIPINATVTEIVVTNTIPVPEDIRGDKIKVLSVAPMLAETMRIFIDALSRYR